MSSRSFSTQHLPKALAGVFLLPHIIDSNTLQLSLPQTNPHLCTTGFCFLHLFKTKNQ
tara:strand:- start:465 stop:638 length:174 start_codon:yes stop_codon:yes gene_type:complete